MNENNLKEIGELALRHYVIRKRIEKIRSSYNRCTEETQRSPWEESSTPSCRYDYFENNIGLEDVCKNCKDFLEKRKKVNRISKEGAILKRRMTWKIKKEIKESSLSIPMTTEHLFDSIT